MEAIVADRKEIMALFHRLWTKAVGKEDYAKTEWKIMEKYILDLMDDGDWTSTGQPADPGCEMGQA